MVKKSTIVISGIEDTHSRSTGHKCEINHRARSRSFAKNRHIKTITFVTEVPMLRKLFYNESGQDMIEYALLASFISIVAIATLRLIGPLVSTIYENIVAALS